jgi:hypothetical protein
MQLAFQQSGAEFNPIDDGVVSVAYDNAWLRLTGGGRNVIRPSSSGRPC